MKNEEKKLGPCQCSDPGCFSCQGECMESATGTLRRSDYVDESDISMCEGCTDDALNSGLFYFVDDWEPEEDQCPELYDADAIWSDRNEFSDEN